MSTTMRVLAGMACYLVLPDRLYREELAWRQSSRREELAPPRLSLWGCRGIGMAGRGAA
jgi:hypothetical protein